MKFIDLFSGMGGFRIGMELAGHECVGFCEYDKLTAAAYTSMHLITDEQRDYLATLPLRQRQKEILKEEYRNGEWYCDDIRSAKGADVPWVDCWTGGYPCQDISVAGKQAGLSGDRSGLFFEIIRLLKEKEENDRPEWVLLENVKNMLSIDGGGGMLTVLSELDEVGYDCQWQVFNSAEWGVPQNRERVYIVGHLRTRGSRKVFPVENTDGKDSLHEINILAHHKSYRRNTQTFDSHGITEALSTCQGGGREHHVAIPVTVNRLDGIRGGGVK